MAKLKIIAPGTADDPDVPGYVSVVENLILKVDKYLEFLDALPDERASLLQTAADANGGSHIVKQQAADGTYEAITNNNCKILAERDNKHQGTRKSKVTVPMPDVPPSSFDYLSGYASKIVGLYNGGHQDTAHKFMFGIMMLTRCR